MNIIRIVSEIIMKKSLKKEVIKMNKMLIAVMALAMFAAFLPKAEAGESVQLGLKVTFEDPDLTRVLELKNIVYQYEAWAREIYDSASNSGDPAVIEQAIKDLAILKDVKLEGLKNELVTILDRRPDLEQQINAVLEHAKVTQEAITVYIEKLSSLLDVIAIELEGPNPWVLEGVKLGERRSNYPDVGIATKPSWPIHLIKNTGKVCVTVDIGYVNDIVIPEAPKPGFEQGLDTYITIANDGVIPPNERKIIIGSLPAGNGTALSLTYGAPTALSNPTEGMGAGYEVRAYKAICKVEA